MLTCRANLVGIFWPIFHFFVALGSRNSTFLEKMANIFKKKEKEKPGKLYVQNFKTIDTADFELWRTLV